MYLQKITLQNIKCFEHVEIDFTNGKDIRKWTVIFGENGLGKSTLLQAMAVALAGPIAIRELIPVAEGWTRSPEGFGEIIAKLVWTEGDSLTAIAEFGKPKTKTAYTVRYAVIGTETNALPELLAENYPSTIVQWSGNGESKERENITKDMKRLQQTAYTLHKNKTGWLACGYGPFRRLSGGSQQAERILYAGRDAVRFITLFREDAALTNVKEWLIELYNTARDGDANNERILKLIKKIFAENLFPEPIELIIKANEVTLKVSNNVPVPIQDLSDGYRSMLALSTDLLRWLTQAFPDKDKVLDCAGVVLIDELDAHLHPKWQRQIGYWLRQKFPNIQFIIATHSPYLAQVDDTTKNLGDNDQVVSGNIVLKQTEHGVIAVRTESMQNLGVDQILQSTLFDMDTLNSPQTEQKLNKYAELNRQKYIRPLSETEKQEYEQLEILIKQLPMSRTPEGRHMEHVLAETVDYLKNQLKGIS